MLRGSDLPEGTLRTHLWSEAANAATNLDSIMVRPGQKLSPFQKFFGKGAKSHVGDAKNFGEKCIVADRTAIKAKFADRGKVMYWLGYAKNHASGTYRGFNLDTRGI